MTFEFRQRLLATTLIVSAGFIATPAFAQYAPPPQPQPVPDAALPGTQEETPSSATVEGQPPPEVNADGETREAGEEIVVTGTRIARPNVESASPVTVVGSEEVRQSGVTRVEDLLNQLPQVTPGQTAFVSNGASGTATVNLRGLGTERTLVLVNGRRLQPGDPYEPVADINQIPAALIKRIEVLTGGASATYGADAVAGVVNFIMDTDFTGFQLDANYGVYQHNNHNDQNLAKEGQDDITIRDRLNQKNFSYPRGNQVDGAQFDTTATLGASFDDGRGNAVAYLGYRQVQPLLQRDRDHSACALSLSSSTGNILCGGSFTTPIATIVDPSFGYYFFASAGPGQFQSFQGAYNYAPVNFFQRPDKRYTAGAFANYEISPLVQPYAEFMFMDDRSDAQIAESGTFFADTINIRCDSPLLSASQGAALCESIDAVEGAGDFIDTNGDDIADTDPTGPGVVPILIGKRNVEGGPRSADLRHTGYRAVLGTRGDFSERFSYDVSGTYGSTIYGLTYRNDLSRSRLRQALNAVVDANGNVVCAINADNNPANDDPNCVPYNPFQGQGLVTDPRQGITQEAINFVSTPGIQRGETKIFDATGFVTGELFNLAATEPVTAVVGAQYIKRMLDLQSDVAFETGDLAGQGGPQPSINGQYSSRELFGELLVPIISDRPFFHRLTADLGYRFSDYSLGFDTHTYKIQGEYQPVRELKIRGGYNRAVRAPNILELFTPQSLGLFGGSDPCAGPDPEFTEEQCARTGVRPNQYGRIAASPADQYNQITGGNPNAQPEKADTWTIGAVVEPRNIIPGFVATVDYFKITLDNAVSGIGAETILRQCGLTGDPQFCSLVRRNPISGDLFSGSDPATSGFVTNITQNIGGLETSGIDAGLSYNRQMFGGRANFDIIGTYLLDSIFDTGIEGQDVQGNATDGAFDCNGFNGSICGFPTPKWRHTARAAFTMRNGVGFSARWRHIGKVKHDQRSGDPDLGSFEGDPDEPNFGENIGDPRGDIDAFDYLDLTASANVTERLRLLIGVNNVFDTDPPLRPAAFGTDNANTWAGTYDPVGRYLFVKGTIRY